MSKQTINIGASPNDGTGTPLRTSFDYCNLNFTELYTATGPSGNNIVVPGTATITGDLTVDTSTLKVDSTLNKVGIGVATLTGLSTLNVAGDVAITSDLILKNGSGTAQGYIFGSSGLNYRVIASNPHVWQEGGTDLMRLNSTGLAIGDSPFSGTRLTLKESATNPNVLALINRNATQTWKLAVDTAAVDDKILGFFSPTTSTFVFQLTDTGNVGIGVTPAGTGGCLQLKSGVTFPATQVASSDANTLDDYEEGTFTATLTGGTTNPTTPVTTTGRYTKVGRLVTVQIEFINVSTVGASGTLGISGLPFVNSSRASTGIATLYNLATFTGSPIVFLDSSVSVLAFYGLVSNSIYSNVTHNAGVTGYSTTTITYSV
jgi:hypothetical protein